MSYEPPPRRYPKAPFERRTWAFVIDFLAIWFISSFAPVFGRWLVFLGLWMVNRVVIAERNRGQSLGHWALDLTVISLRFERIPALIDFTKREGLLAIAAMLAMVGLTVNLSNGVLMLMLLSPVLVDCGLALSDEEFSQAFHDRLADTMVIQSARGFSLDLKLKKLLGQIQENMRK